LPALNALNHASVFARIVAASSAATAIGAAANQNTPAASNAILFKTFIDPS